MTVPVSGQEARSMTITDIIEMPSIADPQLSPDASSVLFVRSDADWDENDRVSHIWISDAGGSESRQLTWGEGGESSPRWSPGGDLIAFLASRGEDEIRQIYLLPVGGGEARALTGHPTDVGSIAWAPDGRTIYFVAEDDKSEEEKERERLQDDVYAFEEDYQQRHLWRFDLDSGTAHKVTVGDYSVMGYRLSRDGRRIAMHRMPTPLREHMTESEVWVIDADGGNATRVTHNEVPETGAELSPDNRYVLYRADSNLEGEFYYNDNLFLASASTGEVRELFPAFGGEINAATFDRDGSGVLFRANLGVRVELFQGSLEADEPVRLTEGDHQISGWHYVPQVDRHLVQIRSADDPGDLWLVDRESTARVTRVFDDLTEQFRLPRQEVLRWRGEDGVEVEGLLFYPLDYVEGQRYPLVVQTHGGPASSDKFQFASSSTFVPVLASMGYFVLKPNYRGSTGYGDEFLRDMVGHYFNQAHTDVMTGVDHLIERGLVDGDRMAKMGWSAGGHMTNKIITHTNRFKAAVSGAGAANWISMYAQSDVRIYRTPWFGGTPWERDAPIERYWEDSPLREAWKVETPTIFLVGEEDPRVPMPQSVEMYRALKHNGVPTHLYVAPRQGHGWSELRHQLFRANVDLDWFERWVTERDYVWEEAPGSEKPKTTT
jgi:dipeptidyl aminopeptidase/acylaminoacyl peptidase